jgi:hypothetical protein
MKPLLLIPAFAVLTLTGCLTGDGEDELDIQPPAISAPATSAAIAPAQFVEVPPDADQVPLAFAVRDDRGISEIVIESHNGFDGHTHKSFNDFALLSYRHVVTREDLADPLRFQSPADESLVIYLDDRNPAIPTDALPLAGPYHFSIKAADVSGNETAYADNSTYHTTLFLQRHYAPQMRVDDIDRGSGTVTGELWRNQEDDASSDIVFLWAYVLAPDPANPALEGTIRTEWLWGESNWPHQFRADSGQPLPGGERIELGKLLRDQDAVRQMSASDRLRLWAEDENGNITVRTF